MKARIAIACLAALAGSLVTSQAWAQFSSDPANQLQLGGPAGNIVSRVKHNPLGGYYVAWQGSQGGGGNAYVQRLDDLGNPMWAIGGVQVSDAQNTGSFEDFGLDVDANGSVVVAYRDNHTGTIRISLQKVLSDGSTPWGTNGVTVAGISGATDTPHSPRVVATSDGAYVVAFSQGITTSTATTRACYQKVDSGGNFLWNGGQPVVIAPAANGYTAADMVPAENGNVDVVVYTYGGFTVSRRCHVQKLDSASGAQLWNGGAPVVIQTAGSMQIGYFPKVISDGAGGLLVSWYTSSPLQCFVQHVDTTGAPLFAAGGAVGSANSGRVRTDPAIAYDPSLGQTYMTFIEQNTLQSQRGVYAQIFNSTGALQLGDGLEVLPVLDTITNGTPQNPRMALTTNGAIASWQFGTDSSGSTNMLIQAAKISNEGSLPWVPAVTTVNSDNSVAKGRIETASIPGGGVVDVYGFGSGTWTIEASRINDDGSLGNPVSHCGTADFNCDGNIGTDQDIESFFACLAGSCPAAPCTNNADFNADGNVGTDQDIESFFRVLAGGNC